MYRNWCMYCMNETQIYKSFFVRAFTGIYWDHEKPGIYRCIVCDQELFSSSTKFNSGSGWPSFYDVMKQGTVKELVDRSLGMKRTEIVCSKVRQQLFHEISKFRLVYWKLGKILNMMYSGMS